MEEKKQKVLDIVAAGLEAGETMGVICQTICDELDVFPITAARWYAMAKGELSQ